MRLRARGAARGERCGGTLRPAERSAGMGESYGIASGCVNVFKTEDQYAI